MARSSSTPPSSGPEVLRVHFNRNLARTLNASVWRSLRWRTPASRPIRRGHGSKRSTPATAASSATCRDRGKSAWRSCGSGRASFCASSAADGGSRACCSARRSPRRLGTQRQAHAGAGAVEALHSGGDAAAHPQWRGAYPQPPPASGDGLRDVLVGFGEFAEDAPRALERHRPERGGTHAVRQALKRRGPGAVLMQYPHLHKQRGSGFWRPQLGGNGHRAGQRRVFLLPSFWPDTYHFVDTEPFRF